MNVLIIGLGSIAGKHIQALLNIKGVEVNIYALRSTETASITPHVTNISSVDTAGVVFDFAIVSNPTSVHFKTLKDLLHYKIPLLIEKPLFHVLAGGEELVNRFQQSNIKTYVACNLRFHPCVIFMKDFLRNEMDKINEVNVYCGSYLPSWRPGADYRSVYSANKELGGGVHLDLIHELDYVHWFWGSPTKVHSLFRKNSELEMDAIDYANYLLEYDKFVVNITLNYYRRDTKRTCEIVFANKTVVVDIVQQKVWCDGQVIFSSEVDSYYTYQEQMKYFLSSLNTEEPFMNSMEEAFGILKICLNND